MILTLENFRDQIHALILTRGEEYFAKGLVNNLELTSTGWVAQVGSDSIYKVVLSGENSFESWDCECPFDHGPICKHAAATMLAVEHHFQYITDEIEMAHQLLKDVDPEELHLFVKAYIEKSQAFRKHFLATYYKASK